MLYKQKRVTVVYSTDFYHGITGKSRCQVAYTTEKNEKSPRADARGDELRRMNCFRGGLAAGTVGIAAAPVAAASVAAAAAVTTAEEQQENDDNDPAAVTAKETVVIAHSRTSNEIVD